MRQRLYLRPGWSWLSRGDKASISPGWDCRGLVQGQSPACTPADHAPHHLSLSGLACEGQKCGIITWASGWSQTPPPTLPCETYQLYIFKSHVTLCDLYFYCDWSSVILKFCFTCSWSFSNYKDSLHLSVFLLLLS